MAWYEGKNLKIISEYFKVVVAGVFFVIAIELYRSKVKLQQDYDELLQKRYEEQKQSAEMWQNAYFKANSLVVHDTIRIAVPVKQ